MNSNLALEISSLLFFIFYRSFFFFFIIMSFPLLYSISLTYARKDYLWAGGKSLTRHSIFFFFSPFFPPLLTGRGLYVSFLPSSATLDLDAKEHDEGEDSSRYSVSFVVDVKSLQAELDRLRRAAVALTAKEGNVGRVSALSSSSTLSAVPTNNHNLDNTSSTRRRSSGGGSRLSFPRGLFRNGAGSGSSDSNIWPLGRTGGDATTTTAVSADEDCYDGAGEVAAGASTRSTEAFGSAARNSFSSSVNTGPAPATSGDTAGVAPPSVTVLHLVMKAAAASLLEIMPSLPRVRRPCTAGQEELAVGLSERNAGDYGCEAAGSAAPKVFLAGGDSFNVGGCYGADVMATRVACAVSSLSSRGGLRVFGEGSRGEGRTRGGRSAGNGRDLVIVESAERKSAAAIATEIEQAGAIAAAAAGVVMAPILNAADNELSSFTRRDDGNHGDIASGSLLFQERVPLLHAEHSEATKAVISQVRPRFKVESHAAVDGRTGGGKIRRYAYRCANNALLGLEDSPEELRARWLEGELSYFAAAAAPAAVTASSAQAVGVTSATSATATTASTRKPQERVPLLHAADVSRLLASWDHRTGSWGSLEGGRLESGRRASAAGASVACMDCFVEMRPSAQRANTSATFATDSIGSTLSAVMEADPVSSGGGDDADKDGGGRSGRVTFAENTTFFTSGRLGSAGSSQKKDRRRRRSHHQRRQSSENSSFASLFRQKQEQARILSSSSRMSFSAAKQSQKEEVDDDDDDQDCDDQPLEVAVIPRPAGDGVEPLLRVIVGRVSALRCRGGGKGTGVSGSGEGAGGRGEMAAPPVIVLQVSVVGARAVGAGVTLGFAEALRRRLLAAGPDV